MYYTAKIRKEVRKTKTPINKRQKFFADGQSIYLSIHDATK